MPIFPFPNLPPAAARVLNAALQAVEPEQAVRRALERHPGWLRPAPGGKIVLLAVGKAALGMARAAVEKIPLSGLVIPKAGPSFSALSLPGLEILPAAHPVPDERSLLAGQKALRLAQSLRQGDLLLCLISGGGSALMTLPRLGLKLGDLQTLTRALLACGARIDEINTLRRHLDQVKGGGLARAAFPARTLSLILSDVVGSPLEAIASGPTAPDPSTREQAFAILEKYGLRESLPANLVWALRQSPETPKPGQALFESVSNRLVGSNSLALRAALRQARAEGWQALSLGSAWQGEARLLGPRLAHHFRLALRRLPRPFCLAAGGEATVTLRGSGRGGRNLEVALSALPWLAGLENVWFITLATDGEDGSTSAAGAWVTGETARRAQALGLRPAEFLQNNDSYAFFSALGALLQPGPTGTNVNDLTLMLAL